ncbi:amidohydrolase family protein [Quadrisphaera sp. KR29]|uniref:amidohydrolase family protein n=1 Tax=Quadrisphaera sp. KR29 TaxID=3461391 RepID=UPI004043CBF1
MTTPDPPAPDLSAPDPSAPDLERLRDLPLTRWTPRQQLRAPATEVRRAAVPAVDVHNHLGRWLTGGDWRAGTAPWMVEDVGALVAVLDATGVEAVVNLDGMWGGELSANLARYDEAHPGRFLTFCQVEWARLAEPGGLEALVGQLRESAARGARGVKVWKDLGLSVRDAGGALVAPDDPRVVEVLSTAGQLGLPVLVHTADPVAFFDPLDERNERLEELLGNPEWWFGDPAVHPGFDELLAAHARLVLACPGTRVVGAHVGCAAERLDLVEALLAAAPHYSVDTGGRLAELGRQPRRTAALLERFGDRVLFGTDAFPLDAAALRLHFRFFETLDEAFPYAPEEDVPPQGRWTVSGLGLGEGALRALYRENARSVLGLTPR